MAISFLFASSHLPAVRSTRPELEEEEEEEKVNPESLPRSGGVRASSHLEERAAESARRADASPAPRRADAAGDWLGRLREQLDPQRTRPAPAAPDERPRRADAEHEPDHDADEAPGAKSEEAPEDENTRSWHLPPENGSYHPDPRFYIRPEDGGPASPDHGFYQPVPIGVERGIRDTWGDGAASSSQEWGVRRSDEIQDQPQTGQRGLGANVSAGSHASRSHAATTGRLFEKRSVPEAFFKQQQQVRGTSGPTAQQLRQAAQHAIAVQHQVRGDNPPTQAPGGKHAEQPQTRAQAQGPATGPSQNIPTAAQASIGNPPQKQAQAPQFEVFEADENSQFDLHDHDTGQLIQKGVKFGDHARSVINEELENSPTAADALRRARALSKKNVIIHLSTDDLTVPRIGLDGTIHIYVNPKTLKPGTLAHEITHVLQDWHRTMAMRSGKSLTKEDRTAFLAAAKSEVEAISKGVTVENGDPNEERENEAMRIGNIAMAEVSAAKVKRRIEALRNSNKESDKAEFDRLIRNPAEIARMFWDEVRPPDKYNRIPPKESTIHPSNDYRMPESTIYGGYEFTHVLKSLGYGVTLELLKSLQPERYEYRPGPNQKLR